MTLIVFSASDAFNQFIKNTIVKDVSCHSVFTSTVSSDNIYLIHAPSMGKSYETWLKTHSEQRQLKCIVCADKPTLVEMLSVVNLGAKAYCNSFMQKDNYQQMLRLISEGQSWFPPQMLYETFKLAEQSVNKGDVEKSLSELTSKEKEISLAVGKGHSNKKIAELLKISESTVKTHLTHIYKKLEINDRVSLVIHMGSSK